MSAGQPASPEPMPSHIGLEALAAADFQNLRYLILKAGRPPYAYLPYDRELPAELTTRITGHIGSIAARGLDRTLRADEAARARRSLYFAHDAASILLNRECHLNVEDFSEKFAGLTNEELSITARNYMGRRMHLLSITETCLLKRVWNPTMTYPEELVAGLAFRYLDARESQAVREGNQLRLEMRRVRDISDLWE